MSPRVDDEVRFEDSRGLQWVVQRPYLRAVEEHVAEVLAESPRSPRLVPVKEAQRRQVYRLLVPGAGWWMVKRYPPKRTWQGSLREWLPSRASREHRMGTELCRRGLPTPLPIALAERRAGGRWREAFLLHECIVGAEPLGTYLEARTAAGDGCEWKLALVRRAVELLLWLHREGIYDRDYHARNLLVRPAEGPAARLWLIDVAMARDQGTLAPRHQARDLAHLFDSLRYVLDAEEVARCLDSFPDALDRSAVLAALQRERRRAARSRDRRAFRKSSRYATDRVDGTLIRRDRRVSAEQVLQLVAAHRAAAQQGSRSVLRYGSRSVLSVQETPGVPPVLVKEYTGNGARRARAAWRGGVALRARDVPTPAPVALVIAPGSSCLLSEAAGDAVPLHLLAYRSGRTALDVTARRRAAEQAAEILLQLVQGELHHPDLSPKNLLWRSDAPGVAGGWSPDGGRLLLVDWDGVRRTRSWTPRRLGRALAQMGDLPDFALSRTLRHRFLRTVLRSLGRLPERGLYARRVEKLLERRRRGRRHRTGP